MVAVTGFTAVLKPSLGIKWLKHIYFHDANACLGFTTCIQNQADQIWIFWIL